MKIFILFFILNAYANQTIKVQTKKIELQELSDKILYPGVVSAIEESTQLSHIDGVIKTINIGLGQLVKKNEVLMEIAHFDPGRQGGTFKVISSLDGIVGRIDVTLGSIVHVNQELSIVINPHKLKVRLEMTASDIPLVRDIKNGEFELQKKIYPVVIHSISPMLDRKTGTASVDLFFDSIAISSNYKETANKTNGSKKEFLPVGAVGMVTLKANHRRSIQIPSKVVNFDGKDHFVKILNRQSMKSTKKIVILGAKQNDQVEILKGLNAQDELIIFSSEYLKPNDIVQIENTGT